jgi:hypothetical protein
MGRAASGKIGEAGRWRVVVCSMTKGKQAPPINLDVMYAYYLEGHSPEQVGMKFGYTGQGIRNMFRRYGKPTRNLSEALTLKSARRRYGRDKQG